MSTDHRDTEPSSTRVDDVAIGHAEPPAARPVLSAILLWVSGIPLWALLAVTAIVVGAWPFSHEVAGFALLGAVIFLEQVGHFVYGFAAIVLLAYAVHRTPWRAARFAWAFWLQVLLAVLALVATAVLKVDYYQHHHVDPQQAARRARIDEDNARMTAALATDDAVAFRQAFADCGDDCDRAMWVSEAVRLAAPRSLAVALEGVRHAGEVRWGGYDIDRFCRGGIAYVLPVDTAMRVGFQNVPAITAQFLPLWGADERGAAFHGAVMGGSIVLMNQLVALGVDPLHLPDVPGLDNLYASAAAGAATASIDWLANAGVTLHSAGDLNVVWARLAKWAVKNPPDVARKGAQAWLAESVKIRTDGAAAQNRIAPLESAVDVSSPVLIDVLLQHGYRIEDLPAESRAQFDAMQDPIRHPSIQASDSECNGAN